LAEEGLRIRTILYVKWVILSRMIPCGLDKKAFKDHLSRMSKIPYMANYLKPAWLGYGWNYDILYQLLRYRMYGLLYTLLKKH
jgi:hypothetical protein